MSFNAYIDVVNTSFSNYFTNTSNNDVVVYTDTSNQSIHLGTRLGAAPSMLKVTRSNVELNGDIALTQGINITGLSISKRATAGTMQNVTSTVTSIPSLASNVGNVTLALGSGQSNFRFNNSNNSNVAIIDQTGNIVGNSLLATNPYYFYTEIPSGTNVTLTTTPAHITAYAVPAGMTALGWSMSSATFTAPATGLYFFCVETTFVSATGTDWAGISLYVNGVATRSTFTNTIGTGNWASGVHTQVLSLSENATVRVFMRCGTTNNVVLNNTSQPAAMSIGLNAFWGHRIC